MNRHLIRRGAIALASAIVVSLLTSSAHGVTITADLVGFDAVRAAHPQLNAVDETTGKVQRVAVLDTGIDWDHSALTGRVVGGVNLAANFVYRSEHPADYDDLHGHGTFISGMLASTDPTRKALVDDVELVSVRVLAANGQGSFGDIMRGLEWVVDHAAEYNITTLNLSIGSDVVFTDPSDVPSYSTLNQIRQHLATLESMGLVTVVASGNDGAIDGLSLPGILDDVISVGATNRYDSIASFTNRNDQLELLAPGVSVQSLWKNGGKATGSGTSYATPVVAAASVLLRDTYLQYTDDLAGDFDSFQDRLIELFQRTGVPVQDSATGLSFARVDVEAAVASVVAEYGAPVPEPRSAAILVVLLVGVLRRGRGSTR